ncbi:MAG TPA: hypothetical protein VGM63_01150 [Mucilaginibacter sp.]|jgi:hypothetical protein
MGQTLDINHLNSENEFSGRISMREIHEELNELKATKKTVDDLLSYKRSLIDIENSDFDKINEIKGKAIEAINNLFNDIINTKK